MRRRQLDCDVLVVGSGPGGAMTAALLAEAGCDVILVEEGEDWGLESAEAHSLDEMDQKWRNGGLTTTFGPASITYVEGCCVGGGSETNAGLYHPPLGSILDEWAERYGLEDFGGAPLETHIEAVEREVGVAGHPGGLDPASAVLAEGARRLGWKVSELKRFWRYQRQSDGTWVGTRRSMSQTLIPRAVARGCRLLASTRVRHLEFCGRTARAAVAHTVEDGEPVKLRIAFKTVFLCAGAIQTPLILRRSGLCKGVGDTLTLNPMIRVPVKFRERVNDPTVGVPAVQVEEFKPLMTLGCSHSAVPHLAMWLSGAADRDEILAEWPRMAIYYAKVAGSGRGKVRNLPVFDEAVVRYPISATDLANLGEGLYRLGRILFAAGAERMFNPVRGGDPIDDPAKLDRLRGGLTFRNCSISAIHLHSTCPMGSTTNVFGRLEGTDNVRVNDSSLLPDSPGLNPQGTILAIARRNALAFLEGR